MVLGFHLFVWLVCPDRTHSLYGGNLMHMLDANPPLLSLGSLTLGLGFLGVPMFFVVSGFCIHAAYLNAKKLDRVQFFVRRAMRLYPLYFAVVIGMFLLAAFAGVGLDGAATWKNFVGHLFFWHYWGPSESLGLGITEVLWTIALEVQFYAMYAIGFSFIQRIGVGKLVVIWLLVDIGYRVFWELHGINQGWHGVFSPERFCVTRFAEWLVGAFVAELVYKRSGELKKGATRRSALLGVVLLLIGVLLGGLFELSKEAAMDVAAVIGFGLLIHAAARREFLHGAREKRGWFLRAMDFCGQRCFTIYLVHLTVVSGVVSLLGRYGGDLSLRQNANADWLTVLVALGAAVLALLICEPVYRLVEKPSHRMARWVGKKMREKKPEEDEAPADPLPEGR